MKLSRDQKIVLQHKLRTITGEVRDKIRGTYTADAKRYQELWAKYLIAAVKKDPLSFISVDDPNGYYPVSIDRDEVKILHDAYAKQFPPPTDPATATTSVYFASLATSTDRHDTFYVDVVRQHVKAFEQLAEKMDSLVLAGTGTDLLAAVTAFELQLSK